MTVRRLIIAGTRDLTLAELPIALAAVKRWIARNGRPTHIVCGGADGADLLGAHLALKACVRIDLVPAEWWLYGRAIRKWGRKRRRSRTSCYAMT